MGYDPQLLYSLLRRSDFSVSCQTFAVKRLSKGFYARKQMTDKAAWSWFVVLQWLESIVLSCNMGPVTLRLQH